ncbi:MAG TPA: hypothetical protein DEF04_06415 [Clostridiales bacterium]|nr:hypothetical protein [Clostridiales bacterium]
MIISIKPYHSKNMLRKKLCVQDTNEKATGKLIINVFGDGRPEPLSNAIVKVSRVTVSGYYSDTGEGILLHQMFTDKDGKTPVVELPILNELMPTNKDFYFITVYHPGHYNAYVLYTEIYQNITTNLNVTLKPLDTDDENFHFIIQPRRSQIMK